MIDELIEAVTKLSEVSDRLEQAGNARRKQIAEYFATIEDCLRQSIWTLDKIEAKKDRD